MNAFNEKFAAGGSDITVGSVEHRRHVGRALMTFKATRDAALDLGASKREATLAAARAVREIHGLDLLAALGIEPEAAQGAAGAGAGGDGVDPASSHPEPAVGAGDDSQPPRSRDPRRLFVDLLDPELGPDLDAALDRLAELWDREPDAPREAGDDEFVDDDSLRAAGVDLRFADFFMAALVREERFSAAGWCEDVERDHGHGAARIALLSPGFINAANEHVDLMIAAGYGAGTSRPGRALRTTTPSGIAAAITLKLDRGPDGVFRVPGAPARRGLRAV